MRLSSKLTIRPLVRTMEPLVLTMGPLVLTMEPLVLTMVFCGASVLMFTGCHNGARKSSGPDATGMSKGESYYRQGYEHYQKGERDSARVFWQEAIKVTENSTDADDKDYIDKQWARYKIFHATSLEGVGIPDYIEEMKRILSWPTHSHVMFGFGINPGILEHVYQRYKPQGPHYAFELEHDDAVSDEYEVFGTWSPYMYAEESCRAELVVMNKNDIRYITQQLKDDGGAMHLTYHGERRQYLPIPHEELMSMMHSDENMLGSAYLFQAPRGMQQLFLDHGTEMTVEEFLQVPVPHNLKGDDHVGMLFWDTKERLYWVKNVMENQTTWKRYGTNAVCWQTATGTWIAYRLLDVVSKDHPHTMTELSLLMPDKIDELLNQIGLTFEVEEQPFSVEEFKQNIMRYF